MKNIAATLVFIIGSIFVAQAQLSGSASIVTNPSVTIPPGQTCATLRATVAGGYQSTAYVVNQVAYTPPVAFNTGDSVLVHTDDLWSAPITIPFTFCFFGVAHNQILMASNGEASFNTANSGTFDNWDITGPLPITNQGDQKNDIMAPWQDLDPTYHGILKYISGGVAPNRYFAMSWNNVPLFGDSASVDNSYCSLSHHETQMAVLYETSNNIDIYIKQKDTLCSNLSGGTDWNGDLAIEGISSPTLGAFYTVPGRNATRWAVQNDAWRFSPAGAPDYTMAWFQGGVQVGTGDTLQVCPTGFATYVVQATLTLCNNATVVIIDTVHVGPGLNIDSAVIKNPDCIHTGSAQVYIGGATGPVTYNWSNGDTLSTDSALVAGTYNVTATDSIGASVTASYTLQAPLVSVVDNAIVTQPACAGGATGSITLQNALINPTDTFRWSTGATTANITNLTGGVTYTVTVTDTTGCSASAGYTLTDPAPLYFASSNAQNPTCYGFANGVVVGNAGNGTPPYNYVWNNGQTGPADTGLIGPATYTVTVTDAAHCTATASFALQQPASPLTYTTSLITYPTCYGGRGGSVQGLASGGTTTYTYSWSNGVHGGNNNDTGLVAGTYTLTVIDYLGCSVVSQYNITQPPALAFTNIAVYNTCPTTGSISFTVTGGSGPVSYHWSPTLTGTNNIPAVPTGIYNLTVTDTNGCTVQNTFSVGTAQLPSISISGNGVVCAGQTATYTATEVNAGPNIVYQWQVNGINVGPDSSVFTTNTLHNGDSIKCLITYTPICGPLHVVSNKITVTVTGSTTPTISITANNTAVCANQNVSFTATATNVGSSPTYQWQKNGVNVGTGGTGFSYSAFANNDVVTCILTSTGNCANLMVDTSNAISISVSTPVTPTININASANNICSDASITFTASITNGGNTPQYQWYKNGVGVGTNQNTFTGSGFNNGDQVSCTLTSNAGCVTATSVSSNTITVTVFQGVTPTIVIYDATNTLCLGQNMQFNAFINNGGTTPVYQWKKNGNNVGSDSAVYTATALANNDIITCVLTSNAGCANNTQVTSNADTITIVSAATPSVTIADISNALCQAATDTFMAVGINAGVNAAYQWQVNGNDVGINRSIYSGNLSNGDVLTCIMTSSLACASPTTATSNSITITINQQTVPLLSIDASATNVCPGANVVVTATATNGGSTPIYQWRVNGNDVAGNGSTYASSAFNNGDVITCLLTSNAACVAPDTALSNSITIHTSSPPGQSLCLVSVDSAGTSNIVTWEKANKPATDSFFIYRTNTPGTNYVQITAWPRDSLSQYPDAGANPTTGSYRYKMNLKDTCGNYSALSNYIQTIYLQYTGGGNFVWTPYVVENEASPVISYSLLRDTLGNNSWYTVSVTTDTTINDADYYLYPNASYEVQAVLSTACIPSRGLSTSTSNILSHIFTGINTVTTGKITLYPNPAHNYTTVTVTDDLIGSHLAVTDAIGQTIFSQQITANKLNLPTGALSKGVYFVRIAETGHAGVVKKLVVE